MDILVSKANVFLTRVVGADFEQQGDSLDVKQLGCQKGKEILSVKLHPSYPNLLCVLYEQNVFEIFDLENSLSDVTFCIYLTKFLRLQSQVTDFAFMETKLSQKKFCEELFIFFLTKSNVYFYGPVLCSSFSIDKD